MVRSEKQLKENERKEAQMVFGFCRLDFIHFIQVGYLTLFRHLQRIRALTYQSSAHLLYTTTSKVCFTHSQSPNHNRL